MYNVILVEDEEIFRRVLPEIIDWNAIGFTIATVVDNGRKALKFLQEERADVILTDIRMPVLNGLDLAMEVKNRYPMTKVVLLSAFNEFDYARKGIDCGVYGYILKSEGEEEIERYFRSLKKVLDSEAAFKNEDIWIQRDLFLQCMMKNEAAALNQMKDIAKKAHLPLSCGNCTITAFELDERQYMDDLYGSDCVGEILLHIRDYLVSRIEFTHPGYVLASGSAVYVLWTMDRERVIQELRSIFTDLSSELQLYDRGDELGITVTCAVGEAGNDLAGIRHSYSSAMIALLHRTYIGGGHMIDCGDIEGVTGMRLNLPDEGRLTDQILALVHEGNTVKAAGYLESIQNSFKAGRLTNMNTVTAFAIKVILAVMRDVGKMRINMEDGLLLKSTYLIKTIGFCDTIRCALRQLELFLVEVMVLLSSDNVTQNSKITEEALRYINSNYSEQITLEDVAAHVNVHPVYLSRLFNRDVKKTFKTILTEIRMEKAKKLLVDLEYKVYEISESVGYKKPRYFSELFKTLTGLTPLEYREKYKI